MQAFAADLICEGVGELFGGGSGVSCRATVVKRLNHIKYGKGCKVEIISRVLISIAFFL